MHLLERGDNFLGQHRPDDDHQDDADHDLGEMVGGANGPSGDSSGTRTWGTMPSLT